MNKNKMRRIIREEHRKHMIEEGMKEKAMEFIAKNIDGDKIKDFLIGLAKKAGQDAFDSAMDSLGYVPKEKESTNESIRRLFEGVVPAYALDKHFIPAGTLEDILEIDGLHEFEEELAMYCELLDNGEEPYFIMEHAVYKFIMSSMFDFARDPGRNQHEFMHYYDRSQFDYVKIEATAAAVNAGVAGGNFVKWSMR